MPQQKTGKNIKKIRCEAIDTDIGVFGEHFRDKAPIKKDRADLEWQEDLRDSIIVLAKSGSKTIGVAKGIKSPNADEEGVWRINSVYLNPNFRKSATGENTAEKIDLFQKSSLAYLFFGTDFLKLKKS